jgi:hypothetical protein
MRPQLFQQFVERDDRSLGTKPAGSSRRAAREFSTSAVAGATQKSRRPDTLHQRAVKAKAVGLLHAHVYQLSNNLLASLEHDDFVRTGATH